VNRKIYVRLCNFFLNTTSKDKNNFLLLQGIEGVLRKAGFHSPALRLWHPAALDGSGLPLGKITPYFSLLRLSPAGVLLYCSFSSL